MNEKIEKSTGGSLGPMVHVVGKNMIQNELIVAYLEDNMGIACSYHSEIDMAMRSQMGISGVHVVLMDCRSRQDCDPWDEYHVDGQFNLHKCYFTLYNVHPEADIEQLAIERGVRGIFYNSESFKMFPQGLQAIISGELWFSRKVMSQLLLDEKRGVPKTEYKDDDLTDREREILQRIAVGATNQEISDEFFISVNTVKSHIYSIYKKIRVNNRLQASLWAANNIKS